MFFVFVFFKGSCFPRNLWELQEPIKIIQAQALVGGGTVSIKVAKMCDIL